MIKQCSWEEFAAMHTGTPFMTCLGGELQIKESTIYDARGKPIDYFFVYLAADEDKIEISTFRWGLFDYDCEWYVVSKEEAIAFFVGMAHELTGGDL